MDFDFVYFVVFPVVLVLAFLFAAKNRSRKTTFSLLAAAVGSFVGVVAWFKVWKLPAPDLSSLFLFLLSFLVLPVALASCGWFPFVQGKRPWLAFILAPVGFLLGVLLGMNLALLLGSPI